MRVFRIARRRRMTAKSQAASIQPEAAIEADPRSAPHRGRATLPHEGVGSCGLRVRIERPAL
jgi:hypothetical protein